MYYMWVQQGGIDDGVVNANGTHNLRPVINIRSNVTISGDGTMSNPYVIS